MPGLRSTSAAGAIRWIGICSHIGAHFWCAQTNTDRRLRLVEIGELGNRAASRRDLDSFFMHELVFLPLGH
jgi:hypothetical protein